MLTVMLGADKLRTVAVSGGFDPLHAGHGRLFTAARKLGDRLVVIINNDHWLHSKKGFVFMPQRERAELIQSFSFVDKVIITGHKLGTSDASICKELEKIRPHIFANGGDRTVGNIPEYELCKKLGIKMVFNVGEGGKMQSSSWMINAARKSAARTVRPWGVYYGWDSGKGWNLKTVYINPGKRLSLQYHHGRSEHWMLVEGDATATILNASKLKETYPLHLGEAFRVGKGTVHRLESKRGGVIVEVALGRFDENDIVRLDDDFGRVKKKSVI